MYIPILFDVRVKIPYKNYEECKLKGYFHHKKNKIYVALNENNEIFFMTDKEIPSDEIEEIKKKFEIITGRRIEMNFEEKCKRLGVPTRNINFTVTVDVYGELEKMANDNDSSFDDFMRDMVDYFLLNQAE